MTSSIIVIIVLILVVVFFVYKGLKNNSNVKSSSDGALINTMVDSKKIETDDLAINVLEALGGKENIKLVDACITRLRINVHDVSKVNKDRLMALGSTGVLELGNSIQAIFGSKSNQLKLQINEVMKDNLFTKNIKKEDYFNSNNQDKYLFVAPLTGKILDLKDVPDKVFSSKMMGDGFAINPTNNEVVSPVNGKIATIFPTNHAIGIMADNGHEILIHFGIDTVNLKGEGFEILVDGGDVVKAGQPILRVDLEKVKTKVPSTITPIIFTNLSEEEKVEFRAGKKVKSGDENIVQIKKL